MSSQLPVQRYFLHFLSRTPGHPTERACQFLFLLSTRIKGPWKGWSVSPQSAVPLVTATWVGLG